MTVQFNEKMINSGLPHAGTPASALALFGPAVPQRLGEFLAYQRDVFERTILSWDALRRRADNMLEHERAGLPPLLDFKYETLADARRLERPANYALLRITSVGGAC